ncbi:MAG: ABC transporter transmembrane domain-containing protein [Chloroflexia bacterium]
MDELRRGVRLPVLIGYCVGILLLASTVALFRYLLRMLTGKIAATVSYEMSQDYFAQLLRLDQRNYAYFGRGDLLSRGTSDFIYVWRFFSAGFQMMANALVLLTVGIILMALASLELAAVVFVCLIAVLTAQLFMGPILEASFDRVQRDMGGILVRAGTSHDRQNDKGLRASRPSAPSRRRTIVTPTATRSSWCAAESSRPFQVW